MNNGLDFASCVNNGEQIVSNSDEFKEAFKYYKAKKSPPDFSFVENFQLKLDTQHIQVVTSQPFTPAMERMRERLSLKAPDEWGIYFLKRHPGLAVVSNAFTSMAAMSWIQQSLQHFANRPHRTNLTNLGLNMKTDSWWSVVKNSLARNDIDKRVSQLRWATMGYHHNWDTKEYSDFDCSPLPDGLQDLCQLFLHAVGDINAQQFRAEAAIVNYYPQGSTLSPHTDHSEPFKEAPLLSFSFGRSAVFLIGGSDKSLAPTPLFLHHGDVMIMGRESRLSYHAVPRIICDNDYLHGLKASQSWLDFINSFSTLKGLGTEAKEFTTEEKNFEELCDVDEHVDDDVGLAVDFSDQNDEASVIKYRNVGSPLLELNPIDIEAALSYVRSFRINLNVRQVKPPCR